MIDERTRKWFSAYVTTSFRETADQDYLASRLLYRHGLYQASSWSALQALEKYLKAILLYSYCDTRSYKHDVEKLIAAVSKLSILKFGLPDDAREFIVYLNFQGTNRYLDFQMYVEGYELLKLDKTVWHLRRYCQDLLLLPGDEERWPEESKKRLEELYVTPSLKKAHSFRIAGGYLKQILEKRNHPLRTALVWKNFFYGSYHKHKVRKYQVTMSIKKPIHLMRPELLGQIEGLVHIPKPVLSALKAHAASKAV